MPQLSFQCRTGHGPPDGRAARLSPHRTVLDLLDLASEYGRYRRIRPQLWAGLSGHLLDAGVGTGRNIAYYPRGTEVTGIDLSPGMLARAEKRRAHDGRDVELLEMDVRETPFADGHFDGIVSTFLFCVLDDAHQLPALKELARICRPGGEIRLLEYAYSAHPVRRFFMKVLWARLAYKLYGAKFDRNTEQYVDAAGLKLIEQRFVFKDIIKLLVLRRP